MARSCDFRRNLSPESIPRRMSRYFSMGAPTMLPHSVQDPS